MKKINDIHFNIFIIYLVANIFFMFQNNVSIIINIIMLLTNIIFIIINIKKIKIDLIDILILLIPLVYLFIPILNLNYSSINENLLFVFKEITLTTTILSLRRNLDKERIIKLLNIIQFSGFISIILTMTIYTYQNDILGLTMYFGDTWISSIDRLYGIFFYCNITANFYLVCCFISLLKIVKSNRNIDRVILFSCLSGFLYTFSKMMTIALIVLLIIYIIYSLIMKHKDNVLLIFNEIVALFIPLNISLIIYREYLMTNDILKYLIVMILLHILYILIIKLINILNKKIRPISFIIFVIEISIYLILLINPIVLPYHIKNIKLKEQYYVTDFTLTPNEEHTIKIDYDSNNNANFKLKALIQKQLVPYIYTYESFDDKTEITIKPTDNIEYFLLSVEDITSSTDITINHIYVDGKEYPINTFLIPYQLTQQLNQIQLDKDSVNWRLVYYKDSLKYLKNDNYILGHGINTFKYYKEHNKSANYDVIVPHSYLFQLWLDAGIYGLIYILLIFIIGIINIIKNRNNYELSIIYIIFCSVCMFSVFDISLDNLILRLFMLLSFIIINDNNSLEKRYINKV